MTSFAPLEILHVASKKISCDGNRDHKETGLGHPLVYLDMGQNDFVICPYCNKYFTIQKSAIITSKNLKK